MRRPLRVCAEPGCPVLVERGYCAAHSRTWPGPRPYRPPDERQTYRWKRARHLAIEQQPWCSICGATDNLELDHLVPVVRGGTLDQGTQVLCARCNASKRAV